MIGTSKGVIKVRDVKRKATVEERWNKEKMKEVQGVPWEPVPGREGIDIKAQVELPRAEGQPDRIIEPAQKRIIRRRAAITKEDVRRYGMTPGCRGCEAANVGKRRDHNGTCRKRMEGLMAKEGNNR